MRVLSGDGPTLIWRTPDQARWAPFRPLEISFCQGAEWKALISKHITTIPFSGDARCAAEQSISGGQTSKAPVSSAMIAKVGPAARIRTQHRGLLDVNDLPPKGPQRGAERGIWKQPSSSTEVRDLRQWTNHRLLRGFLCLVEHQTREVRIRSRSSRS
jgi:hypothetical protein